MPQFTSFDGVKLYFEDEGSGTPVVLLHGLSSSTKGNWRDPGIWDALRASGNRVLGFDARGHGRSDKPHDSSAYDDDAMVRDVGAFLDHVGLDRTDLAGYSMGAGTALRFAARDDRLRRLVLGGIGGDPAKWGSDRRAGVRDRWLAGLEAEDADAIADPVARGARKVFEARGNDLKAIAALLRVSRHLRGDTDLSRIAMPTLVVCGDKDASPHELAAALPDAEALVLEGDHEGVVSNPALAKAIAEFVAE